MSTGTIYITKADDSRDEFQWTVSLATNFGDAYELQDAVVESLEARHLPNITFDSEGSWFVAYTTDDMTAAILVSAMMSHKSLLSGVGHLVTEVR